MKYTIGFSNKNNMWTSKYDYVSSNYSSIDKRFFSNNIRVPSAENALYRHHVGSVNRFYGQQYPSSVAVAFAGDPSQNKLYKSMSLEGDNIATNTINVFTTSDFIQDGDKKYVSAGTVKNYGGNMYAHLGKDPRIRPTADLKYMGNVVRPRRGGIVLKELGFNLYQIAINGLAVGVGQGKTNGTKILFKISSHSNIQYLSRSALAPLQEGLVFNDVLSDITIATSADLQRVKLSSPYQPNGLIVKIDSRESAETFTNIVYNLGEPSRGGVVLFALIDPTHAGDMMRGQYAEAHFTFPPQKFELYSLNLNYEPTDLDHSK